MKLNIGGYLKLGSAGGVESVFIVIPPPIDPDIPMEEIPNVMVDENGKFLLDSLGRNIIAQEL